MLNILHSSITKRTQMGIQQNTSTAKIDSSRFIQILLNKHQRLLLPHKRTYVAPTLTQKLFSNMRRVSKGYTGVNIPLFSNMLVQDLIQQGEGSTVLVESHHIPITTPSTSQPPLSSPSRVPTLPHDSPLLGGHTPGSDEGSMTLTELMALCTQLSTKVASLEQDLKQTKKVYSNAYTKLIMRVKKLEHKVKSRQPRRRARVGRTSVDIEILLDQEEPTELVRDLGSGKKGEKEISTANILVSTTSATLEVNIAAENLVYIRRSAEKRKDKGKAIIKEDEFLQEEFDRARQEQEVVAKADQAHDINWSDPAVLRYHAVQNRSFSKAEILDLYLKEYGKKELRDSKKRSREDSDEDNAKKQKLEDDAEKKELRDSMDVVPRDDISIDVEEDEISKNYKIFSEMLDDFDRQDVLDLHRLVQERYDTTSLEGYDLLLWRDLKILFEPNEDDEIWKNQQDYNLISWRLFDSCGIHMLLMHTVIAIQMMIEKKYPLTQEMLLRMLSRRLEVDQESEMAFELL
ncbi:hypothetical protein Tco_1250096, partial [Tanacetum coccineum]